MQEQTPPLEQCLWHVPKGGFAWEDGLPSGMSGETVEGTGTRFLVEQPMSHRAHRTYLPLIAYPTLWETFLDTEPTEEGFLAFANKYGSLGVGVVLRKSGPLNFADPLRRWEIEHTRFIWVADIVRSIRRADAKTLSQWFTIEDRHVRFYRDGKYGPAVATVASIAQDLRPWLWDWAMAAHGEGGAILRFATGWAQNEINRVLTGGMHDDDQPMAVVRLLFDVGSQAMGLHIVPNSLLGVLWYQCAKTLAVQPMLKECAFCGNPFDVSRLKRPKRAMYCSKKCKLAQHRAKKTGDAQLKAWVSANGPEQPS